jgi:hypothetical protein
MGCGPRGFEEVKGHPFFARMNWARLETLQLTPSFVPDPHQLNFNAHLEAQQAFGDGEARAGCALSYKKPKPVNRALLNAETLMLLDNYKTFQNIFESDSTESGYDLADKFTPVPPCHFSVTRTALDVRKQKVIRLDGAGHHSTSSELMFTEDEDVSARQRRDKLRGDMIDMQEIEASSLSHTESAQKGNGSENGHHSGTKTAVATGPAAAKSAVPHHLAKLHADSVTRNVSKKLGQVPTDIRKINNDEIDIISD